MSTQSCTGTTSRPEVAENIAQQSGFIKQTIDTGQFIFTGYYRKSREKSSEILIVYIEGDGYAFERKNRISSDPTPKFPVALKLATRDPGSSVLYIARPCQYLSADLLKNCDPKYWSTHRYAEEVVAAINDVINRYITSYEKIALIGYSGGGSIAALVAARREDIKWLATIGANLDHAYWTKLQNVAPLSGSLNPADYALLIQHIPQIHLTGEKDNIVPASVGHAFLRKTTDQSNILVETYPGFDHQCCWDELWPEPLCEIDATYCGY